MDLDIRYLVDCPDLIPTLAAWQFGEWGHLAPGDSIERRVAKLQGHLHRDRIPLTLVALVQNEPVGSASLVEHDLPDRDDLTPWMASVFVTPERRRKGVGSALVRRAVEETGRMGISPLYLFTWDQERLYAGLGWQVKERTRLRETDIVVMEIQP